ncbi:hypothetical protein ACU8KH_04612 [Lachancea thermotolerans]
MTLLCVGGLNVPAATMGPRDTPNYLHFTNAVLPISSLINGARKVEDIADLTICLPWRGQKLTQEQFGAFSFEQVKSRPVKCWSRSSAPEDGRIGKTIASWSPMERHLPWTPQSPTTEYVDQQLYSIALALSKQHITESMAACW